MDGKQDYYVILGLRRSASPEEIRQAYFEAARRLHPDRNFAPGETELFLEVQEAYEVLSNPKKRDKYDATLPPEKLPEHHLEQKILFSRQSLSRIDEQQIIYVTMEFSIPQDVDRNATPPLNLCLVLDRSSSMKGNNLDVVKATAIRILHRLKPQDIFSVVAFSDRAEVLIPASHITELGRLEARIQMLSPSGGTEIYSGLESGYNEIKKNIVRSHVNHIVLLTDGNTYGDEGKCLDLAQVASEKGIGISGLGIGIEWNDTFLDRLASITGGSSLYVPRSQDIQQALLDKFNQLDNTYIEETCLEFKNIPGVELRYAFRLLPEAGLLNFQSPVPMGPIVWDSTLQVLMEFIVQPELLKQPLLTIFDGSISYVLAGQASESESTPIKLVRPVRDGVSTDPPPADIVNALSRLKLYRLQEQARLEATAGDFEQASEHLVRLATHLLAQGERELAKTALLEAEYIQKEKTFSQLGRKEIKYGTRALLRSGRIAEGK
jgi:Ca-activated chloride channel family protein